MSHAPKSFDTAVQTAAHAQASESAPSRADPARVFAWVGSLSIANWLWALATGGILGMVVGQYQFYFLDLSRLSNRAAQARETYPLIFVHVILGAVFAMSGVLQFLPQTRKRIGIHRWMGRIYLVTGLISSLAVAAMTLRLGKRALFGSPTAGLGAIALWLVAAGFAYWSIRYRRDIQAHRMWMVRTLYAPYTIVLLRHVSYFWGSGNWSKSYAVWNVGRWGLILLLELVAQRFLDGRPARTAPSLVRTAVGVVIVCAVAFSFWSVFTQVLVV
jgi:hypothetical protein